MIVLESKKRKQRDTASEESKAKEKESVGQIEDEATYIQGESSGDR